MKFILLFLILTFNLLLASSAQEVFPTILTSQSEIELRKPIVIKRTDFIQSPSLIHEENCVLQKMKDKKHKNKHAKNEICQHHTDRGTALPAFKFFPSNNQETLEITKKRKVFKQSHVPSLVITKAKTRLVFKAPKDSHGKKIQHIGTITDTAHTSTYIFHEGDYYIESLDIQSDDPKRNDLFTLKTKGKVRIFLNSESKIIKRAEKYKKRGYIELNYNKPSHHLVIFAKENLSIDASRRFKIKGFVYGYEDITLVGNKNATFHGAVTAEGALTVGKDEAKHWKQEKAGSFVYDVKRIKKLDLVYMVEDVTPIDTTPPIITLNGEANITLFQGESYEELGATAMDESDGEVDVTISASVDTTIAGNYTVIYTATDKAGNEASITRIVTVVAPILKSLNLESNVSVLNVGESTELTVMGTYSDGNTKRVDANIEYIVTPFGNAKLNTAVLIAKKDGDVSVQVKVGTILSNILNLNIAWIVDGHVLPPEPDEILNNSTLLGIDVNDNGVRDDVERWIYETYKDKHPIHIDIAMQAGRAWQKVLEDPSKAKEIHQIINASSDCEVYYQIYAKYFNEPILVGSDITTRYFIHKVIFNTQKRNDAFLQYNSLLSGNFYALTKVGDRKKKCDFNTTKYEE